MLINFNNKLIGFSSGAILEKYLNHIISIKKQKQKNVKPSNSVGC